jgi:hypothetical protein
VQQHDGALAFPEIAADLLAVERFVGFEVEQVIVDLEGDAGEKSQVYERGRLLVKRCQRARRASADDADPERRDHGVPAGLLVGHADVVAIAEVESPLGDPPELDRLPFHRLARHALDLAEDQQRLAHADRSRVAEQQVEREDVRGVADVDRHRHAMGLEQRHLAAPELRAVLDVIVHEEGVVEELERGRRQQRLLRAPAHRATRREAGGGPQSLALAERIVREQIVQRPVAGAAPPGEHALELGLHVGARLGQHAAHERVVMEHGGSE